MFDLYVSELVKLETGNYAILAKYHSEPLVSYSRPRRSRHEVYSVMAKDDNIPLILVRHDDILISKGCENIFYSNQYCEYLRDIYTDRKALNMRTLVSYPREKGGCFKIMLEHLLTFKLRRCIQNTDAFWMIESFFGKPDSRNLTFNLCINNHGNIKKGVLDLPHNVDHVIYNVDGCDYSVRVIELASKKIKLDDIQTYDIGDYYIQFILGVVYSGADRLFIIATPKSKTKSKESGLDKGMVTKVVNDLFHPCYGVELSDNLNDYRIEVVDDVDVVTLALLTQYPLSHPYWRDDVADSLIWKLRLNHQLFDDRLSDPTTITAVAKRINDLCRDDPRNPNPGQDIVDVDKFLNAIYPVS